MKVSHAIDVKPRHWYKSNRFGNVKIYKLLDPGFLAIDKKGIQHRILVEELNFIRKKLDFEPKRRKIRF